MSGKVIVNWGSVVTLSFLLLSAARAEPVLNFNFSVLGGFNSLNVASAPLYGSSILRQTLDNGSAVNQPFSWSGGLQLNGLLPSGVFDSQDLGLPSPYSTLFLRFDGLNGQFGSNGDARFQPHGGSIALYLGTDSAFTPGANSLRLASFALGQDSFANDFDMAGGLGSFAMMELRLVPTYLHGNVFTDRYGSVQGAAQLDWIINIDASVDPLLWDNPAIDLMSSQSIAYLINGGTLSFAERASTPQLLSLPNSLACFALGGALLLTTQNARRRLRALECVEKGHIG